MFLEQPGVLGVLMVHEVVQSLLGATVVERVVTKDGPVRICVLHAIPLDDTG